MSSKNIYAAVVSTINNGYSRKCLFVNLQYSTKTKIFLTKLEEVGYIQYYQQLFIKNKRGEKIIIFRVYLKYLNGMPFFSYVRVYWKLSQKLIMSYFQLKMLTNLEKNYICLCSTNEGLLTNFDCCDRKLGGILICIFFVFLWDFLFVIL